MTFWRVSQRNQISSFCYSQTIEEGRDLTRRSFIMKEGIKRIANSMEDNP